MSRRADACVDRPRTSSVVQTEGGAVVGAGVHTEGGDFIGRDQINYFGLTPAQVAEVVTRLEQERTARVWDGRPPFRGLKPYEEEHADLFFGRERLIEDLSPRIASAAFLCMAGPSGSGKSSLVRAGLIPAARQGRIAGGFRWQIGTVSPGRKPLEALAGTMGRLSGRAEVGDRLLAQARELASTYRPGFQGQRAGQQALIEAGSRFVDPGQAQRVLLFVDQFEELFTQTAVPGERAAFLDLVTAAAGDPACPLTLITALRADFVDACARHPRLRGLINRDQAFRLVGPLAPEDLIRAIQLPPLRVGVEIAPELVHQVAFDMRGEPGALPLMQFALQDLFESLEPRPGERVRLELSAYLQRGGVHQALAKHAERSFVQRRLDGPDTDHAQLRRATAVFERLIGLNPSGAPTRRSASWSELLDTGIPESELKTLLNDLTEARLLTGDREAQAETDGGEGCVTLAHERLLTAWPWLREVANHVAAEEQLRLEIEREADRWNQQRHAADGGASYLFKGARLAAAIEAWESHTLLLSETAATFLNESRAKREEEAQRKLRDARRVAEAEQRARREAEQRATAEEEARLQLESQANRLRRNVRITRAVGALAVLALAGIAVIWKLRLSAIEDREAAALEVLSQTWKLYGFAEAVQFAAEHHPDNNGFALSPDASALVTLGRDGSARLWNVSEFLAYLPTPSSAVGALVAERFGATSPAKTSPRSLNAELLLKKAEMLARLTREDEGGGYTDLPRHAGPLRGARFANSGTCIATWGDDQVVNVSSEGRSIVSLSTTNDVIFAMPSDTGNRVLVQAANGSLAVWDTKAGNQILLRTRPPGDPSPGHLIDRITRFDDRFAEAVFRDGHMEIIRSVGPP